MPKICPRYARDMPKIGPRYAQDMTTSKRVLTKRLPDKMSKPVHLKKMSHKSVLTKRLPDKTSKLVLTKRLPDKTSKAVLTKCLPDKTSADLKIACENWKLNWNFVNEYIALLFSLTLKNYAACSQALTSLWQNRRIPGQILKKKLWFWQTEDEDWFPEIIFLAVWRYGDDARWCANDKSAADHLSFHIRQTTPYCTISYLAICILIVDHTILYDSIPHNYSLDHIILYHIIQYNLYFDIKQTTQNYTIL